MSYVILVSMLLVKKNTTDVQSLFISESEDFPSLFANTEQHGRVLNAVLD